MRTSRVLIVVVAALLFLFAVLWLVQRAESSRVTVALNRFDLAARQAGFQAADYHLARLSCSGSAPPWLYLERSGDAHEFLDDLARRGWRRNGRLAMKRDIREFTAVVTVRPQVSELVVGLNVDASPETDCRQLEEELRRAS